MLQDHRLVLTEWAITELREVVGRKRPDLLPALETFLSSIEYELARPDDTTVAISDPDDQPILDAATASARFSCSLWFPVGADGGHLDQDSRMLDKPCSFGNLRRGRAGSDPLLACQ